MEKKIIIKGEDFERVLTLSKTSEVRLKNKGNEFIYFDKLKDNTWRLVYTVKED